ncbi:MAG: hypothetical protein Kow00109_06980 [Acidobacteriota bacterium]
MHGNERGSALIMALIFSLLLLVLVLGITLVSTADVTAGEDMVAHQQALFIAESGLAEAQRALRGRDITELLNASGTLPVFLGTGPTSDRDPVDLLDARSIDYANPPNPKLTVTLPGLMTSGLGVAFQGGRYFARISDNDDGDGDPLTDSDSKFYIRVVGIHPCLPQETAVAGARLRNAVAVIEALFHRDLSLIVSAPFMVGGPWAEPARNNFFDGNSFNLDGFDHSHLSLEEILRGNHRHDPETAQAGLSVVNDAPEAGDASALLEYLHDSLSRNQYDNIEGAEGPYGSEPAMRDDTDTLRNSEYEDATNLMNAAFLASFVRRVKAVADIVYPDGTSLSGGQLELGTEAEPKIILAEGDLALSGNGSGCGLLIVMGRLEYHGAFSYNGLILVVGDGEVELGGANKSVVGGIYVARIEQGDTGSPVFGTARFTLGGNSNVYFRGSSIRLAVNLLPLKMLSWREITPEISPGALAENPPPGSPSGI